MGGFVYVIIHPFISGEHKADKRMSTVSSGHKTATQRVVAVSVQKKRRQVQETLDELDAKKKKQKKVSLRVRLTRAGLETSVQSFFIASAITGLFIGAGAYFANDNPVVALAAAFAGGLGLPRWMLNFMTKRRQKKFTEEFANAIDVIVRGVKTGLPLNDCLQIIASESPQPVKGEFEDLVEQQRIGIPLETAFDRMYERMPLQEVNFFAIVIAIQRQAGGNLAEALSNLSHVLRARKKLRGKVIAFSQEAKSSAAIIGALPIVVMLMVYITRPEYISLLWTDKLGNIMLAGSAFWMMCGVLVMRKMINFDY